MDERRFKAIKRYLEESYDVLYSNRDEYVNFTYKDEDDALHMVHVVIHDGKEFYDDPCKHLMRKKLEESAMNTMLQLYELNDISNARVCFDVIEMITLVDDDEVGKGKAFLRHGINLDLSI